MLVAVGGIYHESNTFSPQSMTLELFREQALHFGFNIAVKWQNTSSEMAGFIDAGQRYQFEMVFTLMAWGWPAGVVDSATFEYLCRELLSRFGDKEKLDGVLLSLHGAMVSDNFLNADAEILRRVREFVGKAVPIVATFDYHANLTTDTIRWADAIVGYDTYPHVDQRERGFEAAGILVSMVRDGLKPRMALEKRPFLPNILSQLTEHPPMSDAIHLAHEIEKRPEVVSVSVAAGFPYADVPEPGFGVVVVARERFDVARDAARTVADYVWGRRAEFRLDIPEPAESVRQAINAPDGLSILVDIGDNLGAGTPGDGTILLAELLKQGARDALVLLADPEAVGECIRAGLRNHVRIKVGGKIDHLHGEPVEIQGKVRILSDGIFRNVGPMRDGIIDDQGRTAVVQADGLLVVLTGRRVPMWNLEQLRSLGIEPTRLRIIVVKAAIAYRAAYAPIAQRIIETNTPGLASADMSRFSFKRVKRPIYPLDPI
jgi:microcystin degradation protein MlrC